MDITLQVPLWDVLKTFIGRFSKTEYTHTCGEIKLKVLPQKCVLYLRSKLTFWGRPKNVTHRTSLWDLYNTFLEHFSKNLKL